jgi:hypothetical protein
MARVTRSPARPYGGWARGASLWGMWPWQAGTSSASAASTYYVSVYSMTAGWNWSDDLNVPEQMC